MKKFFLFLFMFLSFSSLAFAQRVDVKATDNHYTITMLKAKVLKYDKKNSNDKVEFFYDIDEKALYIGVHGNPNGTLYLQKKGRYAGETIEQCLNRLINENSHLLYNYQVDKVYLIACHEASRHRDNKNNLYIGHSNSLNAEIYEISFSDVEFVVSNHQENGMIYAIIYDVYRVFTGSEKNNDIKIAKQAAKEAGAEWAIERLNNIKKGNVTKIY